MFRIFLILFGFILKSGFAVDCDQPKDLGFECSDGKAERRFYFDGQIGVCQPLAYLGCGGNSNLFPTASECRSLCSGKRKVKTGHSQWTHADKCGSTHLIPDGKYLECEEGKCPEGHNCNKGICCPTKEFVCSQQDDSGTFADGFEDKPRFAWSSEIGSCWRFSYYGAKGNYNNFPTFRDCIRFCSNKSD